VPITIGFVGHVSSASSGSIAALSLEGAQIAAAAHSAQLDVVDIDTMNSADPAVAIRMAADRSPAIVVVAGNDLSEATRDAARQYPAIKFVGVDQSAIDSLANYFVIGEPGNRPDEEAFLAGALAGFMTQEHEVGIVVIGGTREGRMHENGFRHGLRYSCGKCELWVVTLNDPDDIVAGADTADRLRRARVDVMFAAAGRAGESGLEAATTQGMWVIGRGSDLTMAMSIGSEHVLASVIRRPDISLPAIIGALLAGETPPQIPFALANGNISLAENFGPDVSPAVIKLMSDIMTQLATGALDTGIDPATGEER
jgi:basic membrane protein A